MVEKIVERRTVLKGGVAAVGMLGSGATTAITGAEPASADAAPSPLPHQILTASDKIVFRKLNLANSGQVPIGPNAVIEDDLGFTRSA
jgi:hypothetical protein